MKKIFLYLTIILGVIFSGCLNYIQDVQLFPDGSGTMRIHYWTKFSDNENLKFLDEVGLFSSNSIKNEFSSKYTEIENIKTYTDTTDGTTHAIIDFSFVHIDSLNYLNTFAESNFSLKDGAAGQKIFTQFISPIATGFGIDSKRYYVEYKYTFYGDIITHNAKEKSGKTLTWKYKYSEIGNGKTISVTFRPYKLKETPYWIYVLMGLVLLLVIIFLFKKKKD